MLLGSSIRIWRLLQDINTLSRWMETCYAAFFYNLKRSRGLPGQERWGYVKFVDGWWKPLRERYAITQDPDLQKQIEDELAERYEPIGTCVEENVDWMMLDTIFMYLNRISIPVRTH